MASILRWSGTPGWLLRQQNTIFSETRKTSSVFTIYIMVAFIIILGSLHVPRTAGHKLDEHWKDTAHRKKLLIIPAHEQRRSHDLHSSSRTSQKENNRISPSRSSTNGKRRDRANKSPSLHTKEVRLTTSRLHPKGDGINSESHDAVTTDSFSPQMPNKSLLVTKRESVEREDTRIPSWESRHLSKAALSTFFARSMESSTPVTNQKETHLEEKGQLTDSIRKSIHFLSTMIPGQGEDEISHAFRLGSSPGLNRDQPERNTFQSYASKARRKVSPQRQQNTPKILPTINSGATIVQVTSDQPVKDMHSSREPMLPPNTSKLKENSSDISTRNVEIRTAHQDIIVDSLKSSGTSFSSRLSTKSGLPLRDHNEPDSPSETNRSPSVRQFIKKRRKGRVRNRNSKKRFFRKTKVPDFEPTESSGEDPIVREFSRLHFAKMSTVLKTTVKRSARPVGAITPTPKKKKNVTDLKRWQFQLRKRKNKTNDSHIPKQEIRIGDETQSPSDLDSVKRVIFHSKGHSLFDHDGSAGSEQVKAQTMAELNKQTTDPASAGFREDNANTLKSKTSSPLSENQPVSSKKFPEVSLPPIRGFPGWHRSTQIGSHQRKDSLHVSTAIYDRLRPGTSASLASAYDKNNPNEKKVGSVVTQTPYSITNDTTQVPAHFSSRIIRGTDRSKSSQRLPATASSNRDHGATGKSSANGRRKTGSPTEKDVNIELQPTFASSISPVLSHTTKSSTLSSTEITPFQFTNQSTESRALSQRSAVSSKFTQHVTVSSRQTVNLSDNINIQNGFKIDGPSSLSPLTSVTKGSSDLFTLHKEQMKTNGTMSDGVFMKERSTSIRTRQESDNASTPLSAVWTLSTPRFISNNQSPEKHSTDKRLPSTESVTAKPAVFTRDSKTETSKISVASAKAGDRNHKITLQRVVSHDDQHYFLHPTTSSPLSSSTSSTSKSTLPLSSISQSVKTQSTPPLSPTVKSSPPFLLSSSDNTRDMITTSPLVHRTPGTSISTLLVSSVTSKRQPNQHQSTTKSLTKRPQSTESEPSKIPSTTPTMSSTTKPIVATRKIPIASSEETPKGTNVTRKSFRADHTPTPTFIAENFATTSRRTATKNKGASKTTLTINIIADANESPSTPVSVSLKPKDDESMSPPPSDSSDHEKLLVKCKVKSNVDINGNDFINNIKNGLVYSYLEGRALLNERKPGSTEKRRKREVIGYVLDQNIGTHSVHYGETEGIEAKLLGLSRRGQIVEIYFQMLEYGFVIATETAIRVFSQLQITEISVHLHCPIYHQIEAIKHVMFRSQQPLKPSATKWMIVTIAAPSIPVLCVICILLTSWYRNHARLRRKAMAEISRGSQYAESLADVGLEIDMEKGEIVSRAGSTSVLWTEFAAGDTLERMSRAGDFPNTDGESSRSNSWNARGDSRSGANPNGRGRRQSPVARQCQRSGKYVKKKDSVSSFHFENNLEDECPPVYESFEPALNDVGQWPRTSTLQSQASTGRHLIDQQRTDSSSKSQIYGDSVVISSTKLRPTLHANIISHFLNELDTM